MNANPADLPPRDRDQPSATELAKQLVSLKDFLTIYDFSWTVSQQVERAYCELKRISPTILLPSRATMDQREYGFFGCFSACSWIAFGRRAWSSVAQPPPQTVLSRTKLTAFSKRGRLPPHRRNKSQLAAIARMRASGCSTPMRIPRLSNIGRHSCALRRPYALRSSKRREKSRRQS